jgi:solute carrier family 25 folate transporter 32
MMLVKLPSTYVIPLSGAVGGAVSGIVSCPLDVIKTKLQAQGGFTAKKSSPTLASAAYRGIKGTARTIWQEEGLRGMYRGLGPMLLGYVPTWAVYLTAYNKAQCFFNTKTGMWSLLFGVILGLTGRQTTSSWPMSTLQY